jgi:hypothetical protein
MAIGDLERIFTADLDLVLALDPANLQRAFDALAQLGYRPRAPVSLDEFLDPETRRRWVEEKGMTVLSLSRAPRFRPRKSISSRASRSRSTPPTGLT